MYKVLVKMSPTASFCEEASYENQTDACVHAERMANAGGIYQSLVRNSEGKTVFIRDNPNYYK